MDRTVMRIFRIVLILVAALGLAACSSKFKTYDGPAVTQLQVYKGARELFLMHDNTVLKSYKIELGNQPVGPKRFEGDGRTPEGLYYINRRNPNSAYHLSIGISYPNVHDVQVAKAAGLPPGGDIFIHGEDPRRGRTSQDWTAGCIAVSDKDIEDIYAMVRDGTPIFIMP
ncbi:L,D-transpeptidase family protein [Acidimangrovimonas pyrenivorans]|uniref:Murein L,D-transpeptidase family protein n=1 Tax=Acidimangrovimonas pyrenivorans TaxID=2030798 RepID=A0ABV7AKL0_9RHOB